MLVKRKQNQLELDLKEVQEKQHRRVNDAMIALAQHIGFIRVQDRNEQELALLEYLHSIRKGPNNYSTLINERKVS